MLYMSSSSTPIVCEEIESECFKNIDLHSLHRVEVKKLQFFVAPKTDFVQRDTKKAKYFIFTWNAVVLSAGRIPFYFKSRRFIVVEHSLCNFNTFYNNANKHFLFKFTVYRYCLIKIK